MNLIEKAVSRLGGVTVFTRAINQHIDKPVTYQAVRKWMAKGRLPRTEWTGETNYAAAIEVVSRGAFARSQLLERHGERKGIPLSEIDGGASGGRA